LCTKLKKLGVAEAQAVIREAEAHVDLIIAKKDEAKRIPRLEVLYPDGRKKAEFLRKVEEKCKDLPNDSIATMIFEFVQAIKSEDKEKVKEITKKLKNQFLRRLLHEGCYEHNVNLDALLAFHFVICDLTELQLVGKELAVLPWFLMNAQTKAKDHVRHLRNTNIRTLTGRSAVKFSWWLFDLIDCIIFGLRHAFRRNYVRRLEGATAFICIKLGMGLGVNIFHAPDYHLNNLQEFHVCDTPQFPEIVLKITFGATGLFHPGTQIHIVRILGHVCNIKIF
jgi:hypothetical protein